LFELKRESHQCRRPLRQSEFAFILFNFNHCLTSFFTLASLLRLSDKYAVDLVEEIAVAHLAALAPSDPAAVLGPALVFRQLYLVQKALANMDKTRRWFGAYDAHGRYVGSSYATGGACVLLSDLQERWLEQIPFKTFLKMVKHEERVLQGAATWAEISSTFVSSSYPLQNRDSSNR